MAFLKYRNFNGSTNLVAASFGSLAGLAANTSTMAICLKLVTDNGFDGSFVKANSDTPWTTFFYSSGGNKAAFYSPGGGSFADDGPLMDPSHGCVIVVIAKNPSTPVEFSYYRFDTATWSHTTSAVTSAGTVSWPAVEDDSHFIFLCNSINADVVCAAVWAGTKLSTAQRATLSVDYASWAALSPTERFRMDLTDPADSDIGTSVQTIWSSSSLGAVGVDSPLLETAASGGGGGGEAIWSIGGCEVFPSGTTEFFLGHCTRWAA